MKRIFRKRGIAVGIEKTLLYLCICAINGEAPLKNLVEETDLKELYKHSIRHKVTALVCCALERTVSPPDYFTEAKIKAIRKDMLLDAELDKIICFLESRGVYYMPLKGAVLKELYPCMGVRQMSDVDIYYNKEFRDDIKRYMLENAYECIAQTDGQDAYKREPVYNFEFHHLLFSKAESEVLFDYYKSMKDRLTMSREGSLRYCMSDEDFYIYIIAHEFKHFSVFGTGIRSLLDVMLLLKEFENTLDWEYVCRELDKIGLSQFEKKQRCLCKKLLSADWETDLSEEESGLLVCFLTGGVYGDYRTGIVNRMMGQAGLKDRTVPAKKKIGYVLHRVFPPLEYYRVCYPFFYKRRLLIPFCVIYRIFLAMFRRNDFVKAELEVIGKIKSSC